MATSVIFKPKSKIVIKNFNQLSINTKEQIHFIQNQSDKFIKHII